MRHCPLSRIDASLTLSKPRGIGSENKPSHASPSPKYGGLPLSNVTFSCRLPISVGTADSAQGAFIEFPSGKVIPDPAAASAGSIIHQGTRLLGSLEVLYYDRAFSTWLPVARNAVSPDGTHYAYTDRPTDQQSGHGTLHVVSVQTGVDRTFDAGSWLTPYIVFDYSTEGIYLIIAYEGTFGLWLMNPTTGSVTKVADLPNIQASAGNKAFWVGSANPSDPNPLPGIGATPDQIERFNLVDKSRQVWFYRPSSQVYVLGQDLAGHPIVVISGESGEPTEFLFVIAPGSQQSILKGNAGTLPSLAAPISDQHGTWFGSHDGIYLYTDAAGIRKVSNQAGYPANGCL